MHGRGGESGFPAFQKVQVCSDNTMLNYMAYALAKNPQIAEILLINLPCSFHFFYYILRAKWPRGWHYKNLNLESAILHEFCIFSHLYGNSKIV